MVVTIVATNVVRIALETKIYFWYLVLLVSHWFADFVLQTHWQATNKSKNNVALGRHVLTYTLVIAAVSLTIFGVVWNWVAFVILNGVFHFQTDYITSRITSKLYLKQEWHNFFVVVGFDQLVHQATLSATLWWFLN